MKTILVVDDQARIRTTYKQILAKDGYRVIDAPDADTANEILKKERIDLMLLDIKMPRVNGSILYEANRMFHKDTKVIVCSVYSLEDQRQMIEGANDYFDKSEGLSVLRNKVARLLNDSNNKKHLIIIDDEQKVRVLYTNILNKAGYLVKGFGDNEVALRYLKNTDAPIDLLILDLDMPKIDGCYFFDTVRTKRPSIKILIASNYEVDTQEFMAFDADGYFDKTEGNDELIKKVRKLID